MNVIIIEGIDNTGKTTVINNIKDKYHSKRIHVIHCEKPKGETHEEQALYQNESFLNITKDIIKYKQNDLYDIVILDRAWYGEYVYGQLYREHDPLDIEMNINQIESTLNYYFDKNELSFIFLNVSNIEFSVVHDDGLSISNAKLDRIIAERELFQTIFGLSNIINKKEIIVNTGNTTTFRNRYAIMDDVYSIIKIK